MSEEKNGSKTWLLTIRAITLLTPFLFGLLGWWFRGITAKVIEHETKIAVTSQIVADIRDNLKEIKQMIADIK